MTQATTQADDDGTDLIINGDVSDVAELEARRIFEETGYNVTVNPPRGGKNARLTVFPEANRDRVNGYAKASLINDVLESAASVTLKCTEEGANGATFIPN